ncbi:UNVERIFIED_ORG: hypothetical protein J2W65_000638 [Pseudomonas parafulva]|jgi:hypothetical protein|uniref:Uncharacterized protein n=1 Tax=Pseudomonas fulva TaxID=47880 RepID=A0A7S9LLA5_9PSED|nr:MULTISPECIES: hypothetical protein [Pseudomonas]MCY4125702.1 hypothetical protein [Pseudomonas sp.]MDP9555039.1 hypothetical protein [Pseudomonas parafulva]AVF55566.1 hypothetical protein AL527_10560 [Pseudomonas fulva]MBA1206362.1 hypothetical protein [Pseudomonas fulva]MBA1216353.1 hypothetical protein [Pseudomonas fulva]
MSNDALKSEILTRLNHAHPHGLGKELLDNYRGEKAVAGMLKSLQDDGLIHDGSVSVDADHEVTLNYPIKLSAKGVEAAKQAEVDKQAQA